MSFDQSTITLGEISKVRVLPFDMGSSYGVALELEDGRRCALKVDEMVVHE